MTSSEQWTDQAVTEALRGALRAPSEHNTQPWRWILHRDRVELAVDTDRRLPFTDDRGHAALLACGCALHHLRVGLASRGWTAVVRYDREHSPQERVAEVSWVPGEEPPARALRYAAAIDRRHTDRRRFAASPIPTPVLDDLAAAAAAFDGVVHVVRGSGRGVLVDAMRQAALAQRARPGYAAELQRWTHRFAGGADGLPPAVRPAEQRAYGDLVLRWFPHGSLTQPGSGRDVEDASTLLVLAAPGPDAASVVRAGEALSAVLLEATAQGLATTPITQVLEVADTRDRVREVTGEPDPVIVLRVGRPEPGAPALPVTPRRDLRSVLVDRRDEDGDASRASLAAP